MCCSTTAAAVELFCEHLEEFEIEAYTARLMAALLRNLTIAKGSRAKENCIGAIGSVAQASKAAFVVYLPQVFSLLLEGLQQTSADLLPLRARATQTAGSIIQEVPVAATAPYRQQVVQLVLVGLESQSELREASYRFFSCLCHALKDEFAPLAAQVLPFVLAALKSTDAIVKQFDEDDMPADLLEGLDPQEEEEDERRLKGIHIRTGSYILYINR